MNAASLFRDAARAHPERIAFHEGRRAITFGALWERVERFPVREHDRALIMLPMSVELYVALLGVLHANAVAVFLDPWVGPRRMIQLARHARPTKWIGTWKSQLLRLFVSLESGRPAPPPGAAGTPALLTFTTGSSGTPKSVNRTHRILIAQHERLAEAFPPKEGDVDLCTFPIFALNNLALGVTTIIPPIDLKRIDALDPRLVARVGKSATTATSSPPLFDALAKLAERPRFRRILTGGAPVTDAQLRAWIAAWPEAEIVIAYGSSEAEPVAHIEARERLAAGGRGYLAGRIVNGVKAKLDLIDDKVGELLVAGEHVATEHEWHRMGDTGWFDEEGRFRIAGRVHSTIWRNGVAHHAQLVEQAAWGEDPRIKRVAAVGKEGRLVVVVESSSRQVAEDVRKRVDADEVIVTNEPLPVDPRHNSKIDYAKLRESL
ncbi:MAG TPA: AMP-binding protein [Thermoanaerobaculia bacterium]|nr:AMP-binding protein [Thermoanaerobaculia bacterium]